MSVPLTVLFSSHLAMAGKAAWPRAPHGERPHLLQQRARQRPGTTPRSSPAASSSARPHPHSQSCSCPAAEPPPAPKDVPGPFGSQPRCHYSVFI